MGPATDRGEILRRGAGLALPWIVLALYARTVSHGFVAYDDPVYVSANPVVARGLGWEGLRWAFGFHAGNWHPLTWLSHMLDVQLFGLRAGAHHLVNAALHALNAALLVLVVRRLTGAAWTALLVGALFALHPLRVESVAWASERKDVLAGTFWLLALLCHERWARLGGRLRYALLLSMLALGLMAKSMLVTLPVVLLVLDAWPLARLAPGRRTGPLLEKLPLLALCLAAGLATLWIQRSEGAVGTLGSLTLLERTSNACLAYWVYVAKSLWPVDLACFVPHPVVVTPRDELGRVLFVPGLVAALALLALTLLLVRLRRARPHLLVGWLWYLVAAAPVIGFVQVGQQAWADRYTYLPTIGLALALAFELRRLVLSRPALRPSVLAAVGVLLPTLAVLTWRQIGTWRDSRTLFTHALAVTERNYLAASFLGKVERLSGAPEHAREHLEFALQANKYHVPSMLELARTLLDLGDLAGARRNLKRTLRHAPDDREASALLAEVEAALAAANSSSSSSEPEPEQAPEQD